MAYSLERKLLDAQETSARRKKMKKETNEVRRATIKAGQAFILI